MVIGQTELDWSDVGFALSTFILNLPGVRLKISAVRKFELLFDIWATEPVNLHNYDQNFRYTQKD